MQQNPGNILIRLHTHRARDYLWCKAWPSGGKSHRIGGILCWTTLPPTPSQNWKFSWWPLGTSCLSWFRISPRCIRLVYHLVFVLGSSTFLLMKLVNRRRQESIPVGCKAPTCQPHVFTMNMFEHVHEGHCTVSSYVGGGGGRKVPCKVSSNSSWVMVTWNTSPLWTDRNDWKLYLPLTLLADGINVWW